MNAPLYVDTSAVAKLFLREAEGPVLDEYLRANEFTLVSSELTEVELVHAVYKADAGMVSLARELLRSLVLLPITSSVREAAGELLPARVRSLDAIHLSTALEIKTDLAGLLTYDNRMAAAAKESGLTTVRPGTI